MQTRLGYLLEEESIFPLQLQNRRVLAVLPDRIDLLCYHFAVNILLVSAQFKTSYDASERHNVGYSLFQLIKGNDHAPHRCFVNIAVGFFRNHLYV
eukprot:1115492-Prorocentrum_minimum.AAC.3